MKKLWFLFFGLMTVQSQLQAQDVAFARQVVDTLTSTYFWGRGYTKDGMQKAAAYIAGDFENLHLKSFGKTYLQSFNYDVNTFPANMEVELNGDELKPGEDFIVSPDSRGIKGKFELSQIDSVTWGNLKARVFVQLEKKLTWSVSGHPEEYTMIQVDATKFNELPKKIKLDINNKEVENFDAANVIGYVRGTAMPDSFIFITAHYDHLGGMGSKTYFPGANDNASGIALMLNLARYYAAHPAKYSIAFIAFAGEEAGLLGSKYYTEHPLLPLKNISFLINTDLAGTGEEGITVVNASEFPVQFAMMNEVNDAGKYLVKINARGKAANSDHYFFTEKGVPAFFFYTLGGIKAYHDVFDKAATLPLTTHEALFKLIIGFNNKLMH